MYKNTVCLRPKPEGGGEKMVSIELHLNLIRYNAFHFVLTNFLLQRWEMPDLLQLPLPA